MANEEVCRKCAECGATCCRSISVNIDAPKTVSDFDQFKWYVFHKVLVYMDKDGDWFVEVLNDCIHIDENGLCKIYAERPDVCREFSSVGCEVPDDVAIEFRTADDIDRYVAKLKSAGLLEGEKIRSLPAC
ncbi:YkgJ family cysteine cluster protein [Candidatus Woesearchaeota archaeon]|nr:YkgJ family cysteine cluster protein [Candidatus Woesearchaeota archaeon]